MNPKSKEARKRLKEATRKEFDDLVYGAMLTPIQEEILRMHICKGMTIVKALPWRIRTRKALSAVCFHIYTNVYRKCSDFLDVQMG